MCTWPRCSCKALGVFCDTYRQKKQEEKQEEYDKRKALREKDWLFYLSVWEQRLHVCYNCGCKLPVVPQTYMFDHVLEKADKRYKHLRHEPDNICLLCYECHGKKTDNVYLQAKLFELRKATLIYFNLPPEE